MPDVTTEDVGGRRQNPCTSVASLACSSAWLSHAAAAVPAPPGCGPCSARMRDLPSWLVSALTSSCSRWPACPAQKLPPSAMTECHLGFTIHPANPQREQGWCWRGRFAFSGRLSLTGRSIAPDCRFTPACIGERRADSLVRSGGPGRRARPQDARRSQLTRVVYAHAAASRVVSCQRPCPPSTAGVCVVRPSCRIRRGGTRVCSVFDWRHRCRE